MSSMRFGRQLALGLAAALSLGACANRFARSDRDPEDRGERLVRRLYPSDFRYRRPVGKPADPTLGPGGDDYTSDRLPNERFDCEKPEALHASLNLKAIASCMKELEIGYTLEYELVRAIQPYWYLLAPEEDPDSIPECVKTHMVQIPIPREIFFFAPDPAFRTQCMSSRLDIQADEVFQKKFSDLFARRLLRVSFPLDDPAQTEDQVRRILLGWSLTPFFETEGERAGFASKMVPDAICKTCFGTLKAPPPGLKYP